MRILVFIFLCCFRTKNLNMPLNTAIQVIMNSSDLNFLISSFLSYIETQTVLKMHTKCYKTKKKKKAVNVLN